MCSNLHSYRCIYIYIYITCMHICIYEYIYSHMYIYIYITHIHICMYECIYANMYIYMYMFILQVIAATNPKGKFDAEESVSVNTSLPAPLLSRFDLVLLLLDSQSEEWDRQVSDHVLTGMNMDEMNMDEYIQVYVHVCAYTMVCVQNCICVNFHIYVTLAVSRHPCAHTHTHTHTHTQTHARTRAHAYMHTLTHTHRPLSLAFAFLLLPDFFYPSTLAISPQRLHTYKLTRTHTNRRPQRNTCTSPSSSFMPSRSYTS